jgi:hypothetical protein
MVFPVREFERLTDRVRSLVELVESHAAVSSLRDTDVSQGLSGSGGFWRCEAELEDLRDTIRALNDVVETYDARLKELEPGAGEFTWKATSKARVRRRVLPGDRGWTQPGLGF